MDEQLIRIFDVAYNGRMKSSEYGRLNALLSEGDNYDADAQIREIERYFEVEFSLIGFTTVEAVELATSHVEENNDWDHMEDATFLQFFA